MLRKTILTAAAAALVTAPVAAQAAQAAPVRASSPVAESEGLNQGIILALGIGLLALLVFSLADGGDKPTSP
jgi:hypothetical protein